VSLPCSKAKRQKDKFHLKPKGTEVKKRKTQIYESGGKWGQRAVFKHDFERKVGDCLEIYG